MICRVLRSLISWRPNDANYTQHIIRYDENCTDTKLTSEFSINVTTDIEFILRIIQQTSKYC